MTSLLVEIDLLLTILMIILHVVRDSIGTLSTLNIFLLKKIRLIEWFLGLGLRLSFQLTALPRI